MTAAATAYAFREGRRGDLRTTFAISSVAVHQTGLKMGLLDGPPPSASAVDAEWRNQRELVEFVSDQPNGSYWICELDDEPIGYARVCRFAEMEQLTDLMVLPGHQGRGVGRGLLERCFPHDPTPELGRVVAAAGATADLTIYTDFGMMPICGHWHLRVSAEEYVARRTKEDTESAPDVHALSPERSVAEWRRLEPPAISHRRPGLHEFFSRTRTCLATMDPQTGEASGLCWVGEGSDIGPAVATTSPNLVPVVLGALDRVAQAREPRAFGVYCATDSWWLLRRLRMLGFRVHWPGWVLSSVPLPGLDRYLPMRPPSLI